MNRTLRRKRLLAAALLGLITVVVAGCLSDLVEPTRDNPLDPDNPSTDSQEPAKPSALTAFVADRLVVLTWSMSDTTVVGSYNVYRWEVEEGDDVIESFELLGTSETRMYDDVEVRNGVQYAYEVSAVNHAGLEGKVSSSIRATASIYGVSIESGRVKTATRNVTLTMSAAIGTQRMQISNSSDLAGAQWEPYRVTPAWELLAGDGEKTVYARFRDADDNESDTVNDDIVLDTRAAISSVTEDSGGEEMEAGDTIHFTIATGEPHGVATVAIGAAVQDILLHDDGTSGDTVPNDGVYERDYIVEYGVEIIHGVVTGDFMDDIGNRAEPVIAPGRVTILEYPTAVVLHAPAPRSEQRIDLSWTRNNDADFDSYKVYRSYIPGVDVSTDRELIAEITNQPATDFSDTGLWPDSTYYYAVYVIDQIGLATISNEESGTTVASEPPEPVTLFEPWAPDSTSLDLSWSVGQADNFAAYELIGWEQDPPNPPNSAGKRVITRITDRTETFYTHENLVNTLVYWYQVAVVDSFGESALSDSVWGQPRTD